MAPEEDSLLTLKEAAEMIGVEDSALRNALLDGRLPFEQRHGRKYLRLSVTLAYQARTQGAQGTPTGDVIRSVRPKITDNDAYPHAFCTRLTRLGYAKTSQREEKGSRRIFCRYEKEGFESIDVQVFPRNRPLSEAFLDEAYRKMRGPTAEE